MRNNLKELLRIHGLSVSELARRSGIAQPTLHRIVNDRASLSGITAENYMRIAHGLGLTAEELLFGTNAFDAGKAEIDRIYATTTEEGRLAMLANAHGVETCYPMHSEEALPLSCDDAPFLIDLA